MVMERFELVLSVVLNIGVDSMEKAIMMNVHECRDRTKLAQSKNAAGLNERVEQEVAAILKQVAFFADQGKRAVLHDIYNTSKEERRLIRGYLRLLGYRSRWLLINLPGDSYRTIKVKW